MQREDIQSRRVSFLEAAQIEKKLRVRVSIKEYLAGFNHIILYRYLWSNWKMIFLIRLIFFPTTMLPARV